MHVLCNYGMLHLKQLRDLQKSNQTVSDHTLHVIKTDLCCDKMLE